MTAEATLTPAGPATAGPGAEHPPARLVRAELRKILTTSTWWLFGIYTLVATAIALLFNVLTANQDLSNAEQMKLHPPNFADMPASQRPPAGEQQQILEEFARQTDIPARVIQHVANVFTSGQYFGLMLVAIIGVLVVTNEFQHQTATATFLATPQRTRVITAKFVAAVQLAICYWGLSTVIGVGIGTLNFSLTGYGIPWDDVTVWRAVAMNLLAYTVWAMLGVGIGVLIRSQLGATITTAALYLISVPAALILFGALAQITHQDGIWNFIVLVPGVASSVMVASEPPQFGPDASSALTWWVGAVVLVGYAAVAGLIGTLITRKRDIS
jgi:ABC-type transport system involved in multi-copper enzyme maturation permease subunit